MARQREVSSDELEEFVRQVFDELELIYETIVEECLTAQTEGHQWLEVHLRGGETIELEMSGNGHGRQRLREALVRAIKAKLH